MVNLMHALWPINAVILMLAFVGFVLKTACPCTENLPTGTGSWQVAATAALVIFLSATSWMAPQLTPPLQNVWMESATLSVAIGLVASRAFGDWQSIVHSRTSCLSHYKRRWLTAWNGE